MTTPWFPAPNPGGQHRRLVRTAVANWITAQRIQGLAHVYPAMPPEMRYEDWPTSGDYTALCAVSIPEDEESRIALVGANPGGKLAHYSVELLVRHISHIPGVDEWSADEDDYDRVVDAIRDCLRAQGRQIGRPDALVVAGDSPRQRGISARHQAPVKSGAAVDRYGLISFVVTEYLP